MIRAFRPINLIVITLVCVAFQILAAKLTGTAFEISSEFITYTIIAILIGASGYLINGHYDQSIDAINHPEYKFPFNKKQVTLLYSISSIIAIALGLVMFSPKTTLAFVLFPILVLWGYSAGLKKLPTVGNWIIAFVSLWLPIGLLHINGVLGLLKEDNIYAHLGMLLLAEIFVISFAREIVKDIQDKEGDQKENRKTIPIITNETIAAIGATLFLFMGSLMWYNLLRKYSDQLSLPSMIFAVSTSITLLISIIMLWYRKPWRERAKMSSLSIKLGMLTALVTLILISC